MSKPDILPVLREIMKEQAQNKSNFEKITDRIDIGKIVLLKRWFGYAVDFLEIVVRIQRDRRYDDYWW